MRIYSKRVFGFKLGDKEIKTEYEKFQTVPDELVNNKFFQLAVKDGGILILNNSNKKAIENGDFEESGAKGKGKGKGKGKSKTADVESQESEESQTVEE